MTIIRRHFVWTDDHDSGLEGWSALFIPRNADFTPSTGTGLFHDALEHGLGEDGSFHFEAMAFGRILALRLNTSDLRPSYLGADLYDLWQHDADGQHFSCPKVGRCDMAETIKDVVAGFAKSMRRDYNENALDKPDSHFCTALAGLLQIGYRDALRRFGGDDGCRRAGNAGEWISRDFKVFGEPGDVLVLDYNTNEGKFSHRVVDHRREDGKLSATWARERVHNWREGW